ncbi:MAG: SDR family NAD(P)-dependent oxidoreductase [Methylobacter sp.]
MSISKAEILQQVKSRQLTPQAGLKLYRELEQAELDAKALKADAAVKAPVAYAEYSAATEGLTAPEIAVIGMSAQIPGAQNLQQMWTMLSAGKDAVGEVPLSRWTQDAGESRTGSGKKWGAFLTDIDCFDPLFFEISPKEAEQMDPQQRLLLQESWKAFEDAGYSAESLNQKSCCVFIGCTQGDYLSETSTSDINPHSLTGRSVSAIAARISYFFNLRGPSIVVNTACSSSLTALVMACGRLRSGSSEIGLVGGISLMSTQVAHTTMDKVGMISPDGKCRSFDRDANGIVPGEAVGVVILKRLDYALRDGDPIHGVIRGYGVNHDGKTNGLTAPSGPAQTALLRDIYQNFRIDPNTINYIEAHGTGTKLGDPIEVHALTDAFADYRVAERQCAIGSIKTNIGHTLEAAGLMGLIKVLLCLRQQKLVPSLHFNQANEHIAFAGSPFYVNTQLQDWPRIDGRPLRAGVSAFGMSGTNAHVVVEEPPLPNTAAASASGYLPYLVVLSAKTPEALAQRVEDLDQWLDKHRHDAAFSLADVAYTLQAGRSHFAYREAIVVRDVEELRTRLSRLQKQGVNTTELVQQPAAAVREAKKSAEQDLRSLSRQATESSQVMRIFESLADFYKQGIPFDWLQLYPDRTPRRIALPSYPFAKQRYWLHGAEKSDSGAFGRSAHLHPLLHRNTSDLSEQRYTSLFTGDEFFLADHRVRSEAQILQKVLPGVVYLEMARAAVLAATGRKPDSKTRILFTDVAWIQPIYIDQAREVHCRLYEQADSRLRYEIYTKNGDELATVVVHAEGTAQIPESFATQSALTLDIPSLRLQMPRELDAETCYQYIRSAGVHHGERLQGIRKVAVGEGQALAELFLPALLGSGQSDYGLHPTLMDAAIQAAIGLVIGTSSDALQPSLPFALEQLEILGECEQRMFAWLRFAPGGSQPEKVQKLDIDLCDQRGKVCVSIRGLSSRLLSETGIRSHQQALPLHALMPVWNAVPAEEHAGLAPDYNCRLSVVGATELEMQAIRQVYPLAASLPLSPADSIDTIGRQLKSGVFDHLVFVASASTATDWQPDGRMIQAQNRGVLFLFRIVKALLAAGYDERELEWTLLTFKTQQVTEQDVSDPTHAGIHGLAGSLAKEYPHWKIRLLDLDSEQDWPLRTLFALPLEPNGQALAYRGGRNVNASREPEWFRQALIRVHPLQPAANTPALYRDGGVYVVIGGAGGIGEVWSRFMLERHQAKIVWIGRRDKDPLIQEQLDALPIPTNVTYIAADARDLTALEQAYREIKSIHPKIHGVVHSAIVLNDLSLARMDEQGFTESLSAKVNVSVCIAQVFRKEPLDFVLFFSSMQAFARAPGQSNYAAGCTFKDAFALKLAQQWPYTFSNGSSYHKPAVKVINWGYWGSIGIVNDAAYRERRKEAGDDSIEPREGMDILGKFIASSFRQLAPFKALTPEVVAKACGTEDITSYPRQIPAILHEVQQRFYQMQDQLPHAQVEWRRLEQEAKNAELDALLLRLLDATLQTLALRDGKRSLPGYIQRWLQESLRLLDTADGLPDRQQETLDSLWRQWDAAKANWIENPNLKAVVILVETCVRALPDILSGKAAATDVMFPNASMELVEGIYRGNLVSDYFQQALADFLVTAIQQRLSEAAAAGQPVPKLRILEIGAGTGGTTATLLPRLQPFAEVIEEYCYTDLSKAFLLHAQEHYAPSCPFLSTRIFNVEKPLAEQTGEEIGVAPDRYDFVIAANVLHATKDIRNTLRNAKAALHTHGILLLNELSQHSLLSHLTFGLLEGWWLYRDAPLRILGSPGLYPETWVEILAEEGFSPVSLPVEHTRSLGLQIIAAQSDGIVRQSRAPLLAAIAEKPADIEVETELKTVKTAAFNESLLREKSTDYLKEQVARTLKMSPRRIDSAKPLEIYGIDSILVVQLANDLRKDFKKISNTLFFEVQTIDALVEYFLDTQKDVLMQLVGLQDRSVEQTPPCQESKNNRFSLSVPASRKNPQITDIAGAVREQQGLNVFDVAVIGLSGRYPQADDVNQLWRQLKAGNNCISEIPAERWDWQDYFDPEKGKAGKMYTRWGGFIRDVDKFDPLFFHISPYEAEVMDPQERLFLQCAYEALQDAGYTPENFGDDRKTGVFVGAMNSSYRGRSSHFSIANRISYQFDFQGPSMAVDTACSASLTALHVALESLYCGTSKRAVVGGVNLILDPTHFTGLTELGMLSSGPECKSFGAGADGFIAAEGVGAVILKPLAQAVADRDNIYGVLKGSAINAGGKTNGYTVPNPKAQAAMIGDALQRAGVSAADMSYIEAHGTGTALGDPIEIKALATAFGQAPADIAGAEQVCAIGSIKSNIGHCESAAGIAGLTKVLLQLKHRQLAPSLHSATTNPAIEFADTPFAVQQRLTPWPRPQSGGPRVAGISSFGAGGANAHVIVEEYIACAQDQAAQISSSLPVIVVLSAKTQDRLRIVAERLLQEIRNTPLDQGSRGFNLLNLAYTLQLGREPMEMRLGFTAASMQELEQKLDAFLAQVDGGISELEGVYLSPPKNESVSVFRADEDTAAMIDAWISKNKYSKLLELWVLGFNIDWSRLYDAQSRPYRISLPTYPFLKERYWHEQQAQQPTANVAEVKTGHRQSDLLSNDPGIAFTAKWEAQADIAQGEPVCHQTVLIVCNESSIDLEQTIADHYRDAEVIVIRLASESRRLSANEWLCDIKDESGFTACLQGTGNIDCLYFLSLDDSNADVTHVTDSQENNEIQLLRLVKYLTKRNRRIIDTYILTLDNYALNNETVRPQGAGLTGLAYAIAQGNHLFALRNIDLCCHDLAQPQRLLPVIMREPASNQGEVVKIQAGIRYRQEFHPLTWSETGLSPIRQRGVYLILGGSGTIGQAITRHLIKQYKARVIWLGRSAKDSVKVQDALNAFSGFAEQPLYIQADATSRESMRQAVADVKAEYPAIHGAIYSALVFDAENAVDKITETVFRQILEVKTKGGIYFYTALEHEPLDFMCYFSSGQAYAFSGAAKHSAYACGITFQDAWVQAVRKRAAFPVGTINWGFWQSSLPPGAIPQNFACLDDREGSDCFEKFVFALQQQEPLVQALCLKPSASVLELMNYRQEAPVQAAVKKISDIDRFIRDTLADSFSNTLKAPIEKIDPNLAFAEYGMDSILGVRFVNQLNQRLNIRLNTAIIFEHSSLARLGNYVIKRYRDEIEAQAGARQETHASGTQQAAPMPEQTCRPLSAPATADIAVIGMSGKFPGAEHVEAFWNNLIQGLDGVEEYPAQYLDQANYFSAIKQAGKSYCKSGGILAERNCFDPQFFGLSPREAHSMNPHQRLVMQEGWKALEDAGYDPNALSGSKTAIFIGAEPTGYFHGSFTGSSDALIASRLSYHLNLSGPALVVNTGCSSSGVAIHLACESLRNGESDLALAGGVNACMNQDALINLSAADMLSSRGACATFDASADGTIISEGIGMVVLKRLQDAIADGDSIDGVICASGINQDGASNGITAPNGLAQEQLIADVYRKFNIDPADITYIEAHGTGTKLGDPVEANALVRAFKQLTEKQAYCAVGSAKAHIGHTSAAAGVIGLIKTLLSMRHRKLPALLHFNRLNPLIEFANSPFYINAEAADWQTQPGKPRMAAINSFGHSGTNAHLVVREHLPSTPPASNIESGEKIRLIPLSAKTESNLRSLVQAFVERLESGSLSRVVTLEEMAYTLQTGREAMRHRVVFSARTHAELTRKMAAFLDEEQAIAGCWQTGKDSPAQTADDPAEEMAQRWCLGHDVDWAAAYAGKQVRRVHLPTSVFSKTEYGPQQGSQTVQTRKSALQAQLRAQKNDLQNLKMEALLFDLLWASLDQMGIIYRIDGQEQSGEVAVLSITELADKFPGNTGRIPAFYQRWLDESIQSLIDREYLCRREGKLFSLNKNNAKLDMLWRQWDAEKPQWLENPNQRAQVNLVEACVRGLPSILSGQKPATDIMFPNGGMELVEGIYQSNLISDYFNEVLSDALIAAIQSRLQENPQAKISILEIGAGTGGTTRGLLKQLQAFKHAIADYCYTDLSKAFLNHAKRHYAPGNPYLSTQLLDIDRPLSEQDVPTGHFDFVIATNVLHATGNIGRTLSHARSALRSGGVLLINEMSDKSVFVHLTFGLLEGWWLYDDAELRIPGIPGLYPESWSRVLTEAGFAAVDFPAREEHVFGQQIIVAKNSREGVPVVDVKNAIEHNEITERKLEDFITEVLKEQLADALQMELDDIALDESFADYGLDSLLGINFIRTVNSRLNIDLETVVIFDYNSVLKLRDYIAGTYKAELSSLSAQTKLMAFGYKESLALPSHRVEKAQQIGLKDLKHACPSSKPEPEQSTNKQADGEVLVKEPIAIVGMSGRFAQSPDLNEFWKNLAAGKDLVRKAFRWDLSAFFPQSVLEDPGFCTDGGFIDDIDRFDPLFFKISGAEATYMDPQQRLFLEAAWSALEDAGYAVDSVDEKQYGVFVGYGGSDYAHLFDKDSAPAQAFWGNSAAVIPARISYYLNIKGPAVTVDTACSGSLVAIHQACQTLWTQEIDLALAGAVSLMCTPSFYRTGTQAGMLSPTGRCHSFDAKADGFIPGEGVGVVALKRLSDAIADGDHIHGIIRGSGINQDGSTNGITAPSAKSQERLERHVYERFRIDPADIQMVEAHGTGTKLGDPIEISALNRSFRAYTNKQGYCALGSVKTNIGHVGPAAGVAGMFKILLAMKHKKIPAALHFQQANPEIRFKDGPFYVNTRLQDWSTDNNAPRRAALSSFGFGGTNAHMVIEEAPVSGRRHSEKPAWLIVLSARSSDRLAQQVKNLLAFCTDADEPVDLGNLSYTLLMKRKHWQHRWACVADSLESLQGLLDKWLDGKSVRQVHVAELQEQSSREQASLKRLGNECIEKCQLNPTVDGYVDCLDTVADLYVQGYALDFQRLFSGGHQTLSLPTYPFAREKYWVERANPKAIERACTAVAAEETDVIAKEPVLEKEWLFVQEQWVDSPLAGTVDWKAGLNRYAGKTIWAVYTHESDSMAFTELLSQLQETAGLPAPLNVHLLDAGDIALSQPLIIPDVVLFLGPASDLDPGDQPAADDISAVYSLSRLLMRKAWEQPIRLYYLYQCRSAAPRLDCEALSGLIGTAMMENPLHSWTLIGCYDRGPEVTGLQLLVREWLADDSIGQQSGAADSAQIFHSRAFAQVRYSGTGRQLKHRVKACFDHTAASVFQSRKTYLLLGGLGLVGEELCTELAKRYQSTLVILSASDYGPQRQQQCRKLEALGATVHYYAVDATDRAALQHTYAAVKRQVGPIHGVFHLANTVEGGLIAATDWTSFQQMGAIKTRATLHLDELTADEPLAFFMLFSSIVAFGIRGSAGYSYACAFLNQFAEYRNRLKSQGKRAGNAISLCWGPWTSDPVHACKDKNRRQKIDADGFDLITIDAVFPLLERSSSQRQDMLGIWAIRDTKRAAQVMDIQTSQVSEQTADAKALLWEARVSAWEQQVLQGKPTPVEELAAAIDFDQIERLEPVLLQRIHRLLFQQQDMPPPVAQSDTPVVALSKEEAFVDCRETGQDKLSYLKEAIRETASELLKLKEMDDCEAFQNYGMDSVFGVQLAIRLEKKLGREIQPKWLIDFPSIQALSEYLEQTAELAEV